MVWGSRRTHHKERRIVEEELKQRRELGWRAWTERKGRQTEGGKKGRQTERGRKGGEIKTGGREIRWMVETEAGLEEAVGEAETVL